ncbi:MAG: AAA family ATPase [Chloroflexi bacterium]|nr:AAA family ATPase [Chloroflexota bacterium]
MAGVRPLPKTKSERPRCGSNFSGQPVRYATVANGVGSVAIERLPIEPLFVDRAIELATLDEVLLLLQRGIRRHTALLGLRRIGKTLLLDQVRRRHPTAAIARLEVDAIVTSPEDFARAFVSELFRAVLRARSSQRYASEMDEGLQATAVALHPDLEPMVAELLDAIRAEAHGRLLNRTLRFPADVSETLQIPLLVMLDEFQDVARLRAFPETGNLLGAFRAALDRPGRVAFIVAGSRVTVMRRLIEDGGSPLFTRFTGLDLRPFHSDATFELASRIWEDDPPFEPDAVARLHRLTGGWPFYVHALAVRARAVALAGPNVMSPDAVDVAFQQELVGRGGNISLHCQYLLRTAIEADGDARRNRLEAILRSVAREGLVPRARLARRFTRHYSQSEVYSSIRQLVDEDFLLEAGGMLRLADPVFAVWLNVEPDRRDPLAALGNRDALRRLLSWYEAQHAEDRTEMGRLFEQQVENTVRQFRGQTVPGRLFGVDGALALPATSSVERMRLDDPHGTYGEAPDSYELNLVLAGGTSGERWAIECKHRRGALTRGMVERFLKSVRAIERARGVHFTHLWIVAPRGIRPDASALATEHGLLRSGRRQLEALGRLLDEPFDRPDQTGATGR